jgi:protein-S-isoprenylcysteine O-methyltransferase Ste14
LPIIIKVVGFLLITTGLAYLSRPSLLKPRSHGFYRFFAWELILVMALLNLDVWFSHPFAWYQLISWLLLLISAFLVIQAVILFRQAGKQEASRYGEDLYSFEKTTRLVTSGLYRFIRHPMYSSLLFLAWGIFFKQPNLTGALLALLTTLLLTLTARADEAEDIAYFGPAYLEYMTHTKRFIPFLF